MQLRAESLLKDLQTQLHKKRADLSVRPGLALIWVGDDEQTKRFINAKKTMAKELDCDFLLHHFSTPPDTRHLSAVMNGLNSSKAVHGIVLQLPLPRSLDTNYFIELINPKKDIDGLTKDSTFPEPTPRGILTLLEHFRIDPAHEKTVIIGVGRLVGKPLTKIFDERGWPYILVAEHAEKRLGEIRTATLLISCTGVKQLVTPAMVSKKMTVIDGSGVDVDSKVIEPLVKAVTPKTGAIGPLTVSFLFDNLFTAAERSA